MTKDDIIRMALEAWDDPMGMKDLCVVMDAIRTALEQPEQEPTIEDNSQDWAGMDGATAWHLIHRHADGWADVGKMMDEWREANTTPPTAQRQWVGLTDEDRTEIRREHYARTLPLMDAVEAKLRSKNNENTD